MRALEAAARDRRFRRAAEEMNVTHSGVRHDMRALEEQRGTALVRRVGARMIPTSVGAAEQRRLSLFHI
ncbi:helix-turn-helix domain-containing protein, partial [Pandoraea nosoerga]|uniref:helix-turn-helix domain-containing protein n=1 Tax=Pandoraea nosoerga TaxID=2508296 RepID=UPI00278C6770